VTAPTEKAAAGPEPANEGTGRVEVAVHECGWRRGIYILAASSCALYEKRVSRAHEFTIDDMVEPVRAGLAAATSQCVVAGSCKKDLSECSSRKQRGTCSREASIPCGPTKSPAR
jgi:hypothetical protein